MAPKGIKYSRDVLQGIGRRSVAQALERLGYDVALTCDYVGVKVEDTYKLSTIPKYASEVGYKWMLQAEENKETATVDVRANHAVARLVALPDGWDTALRCLGLEKLAMEYAKDVAQKERRLTELGCQLLGRPRTDPWYEDGVGKFVAFSVDDHRMVGVLCAPLLDNRWFVHFGSRTDGELDATNPFREDHLQVKDLIDDAWNMKSRHIRLRTDENVNAMRGLVQSRMDYWLRLVAIAHFRAETLKDPALNLA